MFFKKKPPSPFIVNTYPEAVDLLKRSGLNVSARKSPIHMDRSSIVTVESLSWVFSGDGEGLIVSRVINAPDGWDEAAFYAWLTRKNCVVAFYNQDNKSFIIASHILINGGVIFENLGRVVFHFGSTITDFLKTMNIDERNLKPIE